ncbi:MAG TPA: hypothetical protein VJM33_04010, partial [Microthrixaceae bacterium]|nr:hypothetical protein [Microthrixaceae bacterium]
MNAKIGLITILLLGVAMASSCGEPSENATSVEDAAKDVARSTPTDAVRSTEAAGKPDPGPSAEGSVMLGEGGIVRVTVLGHDAARTEQMGQDVEYCTGRVDEVVVGDLEVGDQIEIMCAVNPRDN